MFRLKTIKSFKVINVFPAFKIAFFNERIVGFKNWQFHLLLNFQWQLFFSLGHQKRVKIPTDIEGNRNSHMEAVAFFFLTGCPELTGAKTVSTSADNIALS